MNSKVSVTELFSREEIKELTIRLTGGSGSRLNLGCDCFDLWHSRL